MRVPPFTTVRRALLLVIALSLVLGADRSHQTDPEAGIPDISGRINAFTLALLKQQAGANDPAANAILSPQSIFHGLAMTYIASGGDTRRELAEALGFPDDNEQLLQDLARLRRQLQATGNHKRMEVRVANSAWLDETYADFRKEYVREVQDAFDGSLQRVQFRPAERASSEINRWISERTRGRIAQSVAPSDFRSRSGPGIIEEPALVSVNAVYFKADWGSQFDKESTQPHAFHVDTTTTAAAMMMHQCSLLPYAQNDRLKFLEIPYIGRQYSMYIVLPREIIPIAKLVDGVTMEEIISLKRSASPHQVDVLLPKFEMKSHLGVKDALSALGVKAAFDNQKADFDKMIVKKAEAFRIYLTEVYHDVWTEVHEEGTEAAAVTTTGHYSFGCGAPSAPVPPPAQFHADHPFLFLVVHNASRSVLFAGWLSNPGPREPSAATGQKEGALSEAVLHRVADAYYRRMNTSGERERARQTGDKARRAPASATGRVEDGRGVPIAGADVVVEIEGTDKVLGQGTTDENGRFAVTLSDTAYRGLTLTVTKQGYARWACGGIYGGIVEYPVRMDRAIDPSYLSATVAQRDPEQRLWMLLEIIGSRQMGLEVDEVYPFLGSLRPDLLQVIRSGVFEEDSVSAIARYLLEFWHDPADEFLFSTHPPVDISGPTIPEVCKKWADYHFAREGVEKRPLHRFSKPISGPDQKHALVTFEVEYYHWGYSLKLVLFHDGQAWKLVMARDDKNWHIERDP